MTATNPAPRKATKAATATVASPVTVPVPAQPEAPAVETTKASVTVFFSLPVDTRRFVKFSLKEGDPTGNFVDTHYVGKEAIKALGNPSRIKVTVEAADED